LKEGSASFKKKHKLLLFGVRVATTRAPRKQKFFASFFKKELLSSLLPLPPGGWPDPQ
jgi:hypothetical protein